MKKFNVLFTFILLLDFRLDLLTPIALTAVKFNYKKHWN